MIKQESTDVELQYVEDYIKSFHHRLDNSDIIPVLQYIQDTYGYLPDVALELVSKRLYIPVSRIYGVATFYSQFSFVPKGKYTVKVCIGTACHVRGADKITTKLEETLGIKNGETTADYKFTLNSVGCVGTCALGPIVVVGTSKKSGECCGGPVKTNRNMSLGDKFYGQVTPEKVQEIIEHYRGANNG
ncbi:MAG: NADH-quinone oxidoreductase subunit NuoE family protein [Candidatus Loosdrechtia sp.]|uniref:NADH-quinone oxidoreductase subunit NuoE family protein n=1 Tax=Candidatus Loosdrechtia sp. TaxID=3101272 RepID=UPI003A6FA42D|nr:MAG: NAD(P)H-dependent oxidoreductase subunit E [Candidatus Jettenia sp. AMX2]